jgi:hypothetical protein
VSRSSGLKRECSSSFLTNIDNGSDNALSLTSKNVSYDTNTIAGRYKFRQRRPDRL